MALFSQGSREAQSPPTSSVHAVMLHEEWGQEGTRLCLSRARGPMCRRQAAPRWAACKKKKKKTESFTSSFPGGLPDIVVLERAVCLRAGHVPFLGDAPTCGRPAAPAQLPQPRPGVAPQLCAQSGGQPSPPAPPVPWSPLPTTAGRGWCVRLSTYNLIWTSIGLNPSCLLWS